MLRISIGDVMREVFGGVFAGPSWDAWRAALAVAFGHGAELTGEARAIAERCTGRTVFPAHQVQELWTVVGRRGGKSRIAALIAVFLAAFKVYRLSPGERGVVMVIAADRRQARVVKRYCAALLRSVPMLAALIAKETKESIQLTKGIDIEIHTASFRAIRGYTVVGAVLDEIAFWPTDDAADPDTEILNAIRPAMATVTDALLVAISSPYARRGELWRVYREYFGQPSADVLVWRADTRTMNPSVPEGVVAAAYDADESSAGAEYGAQFRHDLESFVSRDVIDACTLINRHELPRVSSVQYAGFLDFAGGAAGGDSAALAIAHTERRDGRTIAVLDVLRENRPPFSPEATCAEFAAVLKSYGVQTVTADRWAGQFPVEQLSKHGIRVEPSTRAKTEIYSDFLPALNSHVVELLDQPRLGAQLAALERRTARGGRDAIDHPPKGRDDVANAAAGALTLVLNRRTVDPAITRMCLEIGADEPVERRPTMF